MTDEEIMGVVTEAIVSLMGVRKVLEARMEGTCLHPRGVQVATFSDPEAVMCPDCGVGCG